MRATYMHDCWQWRLVVWRSGRRRHVSGSCRCHLGIWLLVCSLEFALHWRRLFILKCRHCCHRRRDLLILCVHTPGAGLVVVPLLRDHNTGSSVAIGSRPWPWPPTPHAQENNHAFTAAPNHSHLCCTSLSCPNCPSRPLQRFAGRAPQLGPAAHAGRMLRMARQNAQWCTGAPDRGS